MWLLVWPKFFTCTANQERDKTPPTTLFSSCICGYDQLISVCVQGGKRWWTLLLFLSHERTSVTVKFKLWIIWIILLMQTHTVLTQRQPTATPDLQQITVILLQCEQSVSKVESPWRLLWSLLFFIFAPCSYLKTKMVCVLIRMWICVVWGQRFLLLFGDYVTVYYRAARR